MHIQGSDRRRDKRTSTVEDKLRCELRVGAQCIEGTVADMSGRGLRVVIEDDTVLALLLTTRVARATIRSAKHAIMSTEATIVHVSLRDPNHVHVGLCLDQRPVSVRPAMANEADRRLYERAMCEIPALLRFGEHQVPVAVVDMSEGGCRVVGVAAGASLDVGARVEIALAQRGGASITLTARVASIRDDGGLGLSFGYQQVCDKPLRELVQALRYPDVAKAHPSASRGIWQVLEAAGYLRERAPERYAALQEAAIGCWSRLNSEEGKGLNRTLICLDETGAPQSVNQVSRFYPRTWLGHHMAASGSKEFRRRVVPQHHCRLHDTIDELGGHYFLIYYNGDHKAQNRVFVDLRDRYAPDRVVINGLLAYDLGAQDLLRASLERNIIVRQVSAHGSSSIVQLVRSLRDPLSLDALAIEEDFELRSMERAYGRLGLLRRRTWFGAFSSSGALMGAASVELAPDGFNLTSIGDHAVLYLPPYQRDKKLVAIAICRALLSYVTSYIAQFAKPSVLVFTHPSAEETMNTLGYQPMARAHEVVICASVLPTLNTHVVGLYSRPNREGADAAA